VAVRVLVSGAGGLIGTALTRSLASDGHTVTRLVRTRPRDPLEFRWDPLSGLIDPAAFAGCEAVIHLAGSSLAAGRWTAARRAEILTSRSAGTQLVASAITRADPPPAVLISASAVGYYGDRGDQALDEESAPGTGFLAEVARAWEAETVPAAQAGTRVVLLRLGLVLDRREGALPRLVLPFRFGLGGPIGSGRQWVSWITLDDAVRVTRFALTCNELRGAVNAVSTQPVRQRDLAAAIGRILGRPALVPLPAWVVRLAFGQMGEELLLAGQRVLPRRLGELGFTFQHPGIDDALRHQLRPDQPSD